MAGAVFRRPQLRPLPECHGQPQGPDRLLRRHCAGAVLSLVDRDVGHPVGARPPKCPHDASPARAILIACWIAVYFVFFSLCGTKLPSYVVPMYPALAIATALFLDRWLDRPESVPRAWPWIAYSILTLAGLGMLVAVPLVAAALARWRGGNITRNPVG